MSEPKLQLGVPKAPHSGLRRSLAFDREMRDIVQKFETGGNLTQIEYRKLLRLFGIAVRIGEILGQSYDLFNRRVTDEHRKLVEMAGLSQDFNQALLDMYGGIIEEVFQRFC
jgi:hypothetical protein